jgi:hypothetical protein
MQGCSTSFWSSKKGAGGGLRGDFHLKKREALYGEGKQKSGKCGMRVYSSIKGETIQNVLTGKL